MYLASSINIELDPLIVQQFQKATGMTILVAALTTHEKPIRAQHIRLRTPEDTTLVPDAVRLFFSTQKKIRYEQASLKRVFGVRLSRPKKKFQCCWSLKIRACQACKVVAKNVMNAR